MLCIEKACFKDIFLRARIWTIEINTLPNSCSRQCIQMVVYQLPMLQIFALEQVGNSVVLVSPITEPTVKTQLPSSSCQVVVGSLDVMSLTTCAGFLAIGFLGIFTHFLRSGSEGSAGMALFCVSSKVWFILPNPI